MLHPSDPRFQPQPVPFAPPAKSNAAKPKPKKPPVPKPPGVASKWPRTCGRPGKDSGEAVPLETLHAIAALKKALGRAPKRKEIATALGLSTVSTVIGRLQVLERRGLVTFEVGSLYSLRLTPFGEICLKRCPLCGGRGVPGTDDSIVEAATGRTLQSAWFNHSHLPEVELNPIEKERILSAAEALGTVAYGLVGEEVWKKTSADEKARRKAKLDKKRELGEVLDLDSEEAREVNAARLGARASGNFVLSALPENVRAAAALALEKEEVLESGDIGPAPAFMVRVEEGEG